MEIAVGLGLLGLIISNKPNEIEPIKLGDNIKLQKENLSIEENRKKAYTLNEHNYLDSNHLNTNIVSPVWRTNNEKYKQPIEKKLLYKINKNLPNVIKKNNEVISIEHMSNSDSDSVFSDDDLYKNNFVRRQDNIKTRIDVNMEQDDYDSEDSCPSSFNSQYKPMSLNKTNVPRTSNYYTEQDLMFNPNQTLQNNYVESSKFGEYLDGRYGVTPDMTHNNMMPFFKSKSYGFNPEFDKKHMNNSIRQVELFTGSDQMLQFKHKQEVKALFDPVVNRVDSVTGTPDFNDFKQSRFIPSDKRQGEKPFQPVLVNRGLNLGYFEQGNAGFQDPYRSYPKTVDQLRTMNNQKVSYSPPVIPGQKGERMATIGTMNKNRPDRHFENDFNNMIPNSSLEQAPSLYGKFVLKDTTRVNENNYLNPAQGVEKSTPQYLQGQFQESFKNTAESSGPLNAGGNKMSVPLINYFNMIPDDTKRNIIAMNGQNNISNISNSVKSYLYNSINAIPDDTLRSIISDKVQITNAVGNHQNGYLYNNENNITDPTMRNLTENNLYLKPISNKEMGYLFNRLDAIPDLTLRNLLNTVYSQAGMGVKGNHEEGQMYNYENNIPETNLRNLIENQKYLSNQKGNYEEGQMYNYDNNIPDVTLRNLTENNKNIIGVYNTNKQQKVFNYDDVPDITNRNTYEDTKNILGASRQTKQSFMYNYDDVPDVTIREQTAVNKNIIGFNGNKQTRSRLDVSNALLNTSKEKVLKKRNPTTSNKNKGYTRDFTKYDLKNDDNSTTDTKHSRNSGVKSNFGIYNPLYNV